MSQTSRIFRPTREQYLVLYWPLYQAQLTLQSPTEANTCARQNTQTKKQHKYMSTADVSSIMRYVHRYSKCTNYLIISPHAVIMPITVIMAIVGVQDCGFSNVGFEKENSPLQGGMRRRMYILPVSSSLNILQKKHWNRQLNNLQHKIHKNLSNIIYVYQNTLLTLQNQININNTNIVDDTQT